MTILFPSSVIFNNPSFIDKINQSFIDLRIKNPSENEVNDLLQKSISYLQENLECKEFDELFSLISLSISQYPNQTKEFYTELLENVQSNVNILIIAISVFSDFLDSDFRLSIPSFSNFLQNVKKDIYNFIGNNNKKLIVLNQEINHKYEVSLIIDVFCMSEINEKETEIVSNCVLQYQNLPTTKLGKFIQKIKKENLLTAIPEHFLSNENILHNFSMKNFVDLIPLLSDQIFIQILPYIEKSFITPDWSQDFSIIILNKCSELDINSCVSQKALSFIRISDLTFSSIEYLCKYEIVLANNIADNIMDFQNPGMLMKIMPYYDHIPIKVLKDSLYEICDFKTYERILLFKNEFDDVFTNPKFWIHILFVISESEENYSKNFLNLITKVFKKFVFIEIFDTIFNEMIFDHFPTNNKENEFLCDLLENLDEKYKNKFLEMQDEIIIKIIEFNILPFPSFWKMFSFSKIKGFFDNKNPDPVLLYAYKFSSFINHSKFFKELKIQINLNATNQSLIKEFLKRKNLDYLSEMNQECLSLIMAALFKLENKRKYEIIGLEKEIILPYLAIILDNIKKDNKIVAKISDKSTNLLISACEDLPNNGSDLYYTSIDTILLNHELLPIKVACKILNILINQIFSDCYKSDKTIFFEAVFNLSNDNSLDEQIKDFFSFHGANLFNYIIHNYKKYEGFEKLMNIGLNLQVFNDPQLINNINQIINSISSSEVIIDAIYFIEKYCTNTPNLQSLDHNKLQNIYQTSIDNKKFDDAALLNTFFSKNDIKIIPNIKMGNLLLYIVSDQHLENNDSIFEFLFQTLESDKEIVINYLIILFEKLEGFSIRTRKFLSYYSKLYEKHDDCFINAVRRAFTYNSMENTFIRKADPQNNSNSFSKLGAKTISTLISKVSNRPNKYQYFVCLRNIAASFPFLFNQNTQKVFNAILLSLDYFHLFFSSENNEEAMNQLKSALSALSFLHSILFSTKILDDFLPWLFMNITSFSVSQIMAFSYILLVLFETNYLNYIVLALAMKHKFMKSISKLLEKNAPNDIMNRDYKCNLYKLVTIYNNLLNKLSYDKLLINVDEMQNMRNPFMTYFNFITIFPTELKPIQLPFISDKTIKYNFWSKINEIKPFWITFKTTHKGFRVSPKKFIAHYQKLEPNIPAAGFHLNLPSKPKINNVKMIRYLSTQKTWIFRWLVLDNHFEILPEHKKVLTDVINEMRNIEKHSIDCNDEEIKTSCSDINVADYYLSEFCQKELFGSLINESSSNINELFMNLCTAVEAITSQNVAMFTFLDVLNSYLKNKSNDIMFIGNILTLLLSSKITKSYAFKNSLVDVCGDSLIDIALSPQYRNETSFLLDISELLCLSTSKHLPIRVTHLIAFMLFHDHKDLISQAMELCEKVGEESLSNIKNVILNAIENQFTKKVLSFDLISCFFRKIPLFIKNNSISLPSLLNKFIFRYKKGQDKNEDLLNMIIMLFNWLAPKRDTDQMILPEEKIDFSWSTTTKDLKEKLNNSKTLLNTAPSNLKETNPTFWMLYDKHRIFLNNRISQNKQIISKLTFFQDFPELIRFQVRLDYFKERMKKRIYKDNVLYLNVKRSKILKQSFDQLHQITNDEWFQDICISFENEKGVDAGGLLAEWFTLIVKELFDPKNLLFVSSQDKSYQPNASSSEKKNHLEYFQFAGKIIARAIIQGQCVNAHLMRSFCRQILHRRVKLKDLEEYDEKVFKNLQQILTIDVEPLMLDFTIRDESNQTILLIENGDEIDLTNDNKEEYVSLFVNYRLRKSIIEQVTAFCEGFNSLIPHDEIKIFTPGELDLLICGIPEIDISDLKRNSMFEYPYSSDHPVIKMFFNVISTWDKENLGKFLLFLTGSSRVPVNGFKDYKDQGKPITFSPGGDKSRLCVAHTCFNILDLPEYEDEVEMNNKLLISIQEYEFGLE